MIAFDASSSGWQGGGGVSSITFSHTCTGSNLMLVVVIYADLGDGADNLTVTYNGTSMTKAVSGSYATNPTVSAIYVLPNPSTGANNVVVTKPGGGLNQLGAASLSYTGVKQSTTVDSSAYSNGTSTGNITISTTVVAANCWLVGGIRTNGGAPNSVTIGTSRVLGNPPQVTGTDSGGTVSTGSQSLGWNTSATWYGAIISLEPAAVSQNSNFLQYMA